MGMVFGFLMVSLLLLGEQTFSKLSSNLVTGEGKASYSMFMMVNGIVACCFFWLSSGLKLAVNPVTLAYAAANAATVAVSLVSTLVAYRLVKIAAVNILCSATTLISGLVFGYFVFDESMNRTVIWKMILMFLSVGAIFLDERGKGEVSENAVPNRKGKITAALVGLIFVCFSGTLIGKSFAVSERVTDEKTYFFFTNVLLVLGAGVVFTWQCIRQKGELRRSLQLLKPLRLLYLSGSTVCTNLSGIIKIGLMAQMAVSVYNPMISALGVVVGVASSLVFREKLGIFAYIAAGFACAALII